MSTLSNAGTGTFTTQMTGQPDWLAVSRSSGGSSEEAGEVALSVDLADLA
jgi:hypothetical protein